MMGLGLVFLGLVFLPAITIFVPLRFSSGIFFTYMSAYLFTAPSNGTQLLHCLSLFVLKTWAVSSAPLVFFLLSTFFMDLAP